MAEFMAASRGVGAAGLTTGVIGTALGVLNGGLGNLLGGMGLNGCNGGYGWNRGGMPVISECSENMFVNRYELGLIQENSALKTEVEMHKAEIYTDNKLEAMNDKYEHRFRNIEGRLAEQAVFNERTTATVGCLANQANGMQAILNSITKLVVPTDAICPAVMPMYNSWTAPTTTTTTTTP